MSSRPPDILISIADDQRHSAIGCAGVEAVRTPHLDALADRGCRITRAHHAGSPHGAVCIPSRAMLHTGRGPFDIPDEMLLGATSAGPATAPTLASLLRAAGYHTHMVGKWHNGPAALRRDFDAGKCVFEGGMTDPWNVPAVDFDADGETAYCYQGVHATEQFTDAAERVINAHRRGDFGDKPLFLCVAWTAPHDPRQTHRQFHDLYDPADIELPPNAWPRHPFDNGEMSVRDEMLAPLPRDPGEMCRHIADYYAMITHMDAGIGRVLDAFGDGLAIHTADHGLAVGQHGLMGKQNLYDHSIRVPLIMAGQGVPVGVRDGLCYQHDLFPTICETTGAELPDGIVFESLWPMVRGESEGRAFVGCRYADHQRCVTDGQRKLITYVNGRRQSFDLNADPWETHDLGGDAELVAMLGEWQRAFADPLAS
ncbi:MAG: sulfatase-like hydrolase/transferase [Planctomycetota bacterium]